MMVYRKFSNGVSLKIPGGKEVAIYESEAISDSGNEPPRAYTLFFKRPAHETDHETLGVSKIEDGQITTGITLTLDAIEAVAILYEVVKESLTTQTGAAGEGGEGV